MLRRFEDREQAGRLLAEKLATGISESCVVAGVPRGGLAVALPVAERLGAPLTLTPVRKLTAPSDPELAFGAVDVEGRAILDENCVALLGLDARTIERAKSRAAAEIVRGERLYHARPLHDYLPRPTAVLVDDGLATGLTMRAAVQYARCHGVSRIIAAAPCSSAKAARVFRELADDFVSLVVDEEFLAVGAYYSDFLPISHEEVAAILELGRRICSEPPSP